MSGRILAIGDIHGCTKALRAVLKACDPQPNDIVVTLGDYVDRGDDVPGTIETLLELRERCGLYPLMGNHEEMLLEIADGRLYLMNDWLMFGGRETLDAYGADTPAMLPEDHLAFLRGCHPWTESDYHMYMHANYLERKPLKKQDTQTLYWTSLRERVPKAHRSGKQAIVGHTSQKDGEILNLGHVVCIDTYCYGGQWLTALDVNSGEVWQADFEGLLRSDEESKRLPPARPY